MARPARTPVTKVDADDDDEADEFLRDSGNAENQGSNQFSQQRVSNGPAGRGREATLPAWVTACFPNADVHLEPGPFIPDPLVHLAT